MTTDCCSYDCTQSFVQSCAFKESRSTGKERDTESGLDYFGARYYASSMGRWMSPDWADKPEAVPYSDLRNPQSLNLYGYVNNNPLSKADKDGHIAGVDDAAAAVLLGAAVVGTATVIYLEQPAQQRSMRDAASSAISAISGLFHKSSAPAAPAPAQAGQKDAGFVVTPGGTVVSTDPKGVRDSLVPAPGVTTTPIPGGTIQTGVQTPNGPVDVRTMDGDAKRGPRTVITHPGTNSPKTPDGKATPDKNDNHIPNDHTRPS